MKNLQAVQPISVDNIKAKIYEFRGQKVMLDFDLASLYHVETRTLNQAVKRNIERFPDDFMFRLNSEEWNNMSSQIVMTSSSKRPKNAIPYAFTEHGVVMLASVLRSDIAIQTSVSITRAFVAIRKALQNTNNVNLKIENLSLRIDKLNDYIENVLQTQNDINDDTATQLELINQTLAELQAENAMKKQFEERKPVGFRIEK
ncbi:MAG: ORF6N domain-containing protein [Bacteroidales bacterium]|nr:ORF6N domain-containing protein [Bacteroidales bacterium]